MTTLLVDGNNLVMTAVYGMQRTSLEAQGVSTGPFVASVGRLSRYVREVAPTRLLVAWDGGRSIRRKTLDPGYKANRSQEPQAQAADTFTLINQFCTLAGVPQLTIRGEEADDLIAHAWSGLSLTQETERIVILSADKDLLQLVGSNPHGIETQQIRFNSTNAYAKTPADVWTGERLVQEKGVEPRHLAMLMALTGDQVDCVRGVSGVGPVKGLRLLQTHGFDLDRVAAAVRKTHGDEEADRIPVDFELVDLRTPRGDVAVPLWQPTNPEDEARNDSRIPVLKEFLKHYQLTQIAESWQQQKLWRPSVSLPGRAWGNRFTAQHG